MSREAHVRFCESLGLQCPGPLTEKRARQHYGPKSKANKTSRHAHNGGRR